MAETQTASAKKAEYESAAWEALSTANARLLAGNQFWSRVLSLGETQLCVDRIRSTYPASFNSDVVTLQSIGEIAAKAQEAGCGNCEEFSAVAFILLYDKRVFPLDFYRLQGGNHAFVVLGKAAGSSDADPAAWGADAVVCDAWLGKVYGAAQLRTYWPKGTPKSHHRCECVQGAAKAGVR